MTDFTVLDTNGLLPGEPWTSVKALAVYENTIAIADRGLGAPPVEAGYVPYDLVTHQDGADGLIYDHSVDGNSNAIESPNFADGFEYMFILENIQINGPALSGTVQIQVYLEAAASFVAAGTVGVAGKDTTDGVNGAVSFFAPRFSSRGHSGTAITSGYNNNVTFGALIGRSTSQDKILKVRFTSSADNIDQGKIYMYKRAITI